MSAVHGGDPAAVARRYGVDAGSLIDFSANIAPDGPPAAVIDVLARAARDPRSLAPYPSPDYATLRETLARRAALTADHVTIGHGAAALIDAAVRAPGIETWIVPIPAFSEYRRAVESAGMRYLPLPLDETYHLDPARVSQALAQTDRAGLILNAPHNPSGTLWPRETLRALLAACAREQRPMILDEAFIDYVPQASFAAEALAYERCIVVRSLTKFYALAGVRIGYALAAPRAAAALRSCLPSWPAGTLDAALALACVSDEVYERATRDANLRERSRLASELLALGLRVAPSAANFLLVESRLDARRFDELLERLVHCGIVVRDCRSFEGLEARACMRIAVRSRAQNARLIAALASLRTMLGA